MAEPVTPKELLLLPIRWRKLRDGTWSARVGDQDCLLRMNDFPEEPLYTVIAGPSSLDIDDVPRNWTIEFLE